MIRKFIAKESSSGIVLGLATVLAFLIANSSLADAYHSWLHAQAGPLSVERWINDVFMAIFFFVVGMEIKFELVAGALASRDRAIYPAIAAAGGMIVPAVLYSLFNHGTEFSAGWGIPMATDIAFAVGALSLLGSRVPSQLRVFLLALAIVDDLGAALWIFVFHSGIHLTVIGCALGLLLPVRLSRRWIGWLQPWVVFFIMPIFAFANAGLSFGSVDWGAVFHSHIVIGVAVGLWIGKPLGIFGISWLAERLGIARRPAGVSLAWLFGAACLGGIGFTMSLFVARLALSTEASFDLAKIGIVAGSLAAAVTGLSFLTWRAKR